MSANIQKINCIIIVKAAISFFRLSNLSPINALTNTIEKKGSIRDETKFNKTLSTYIFITYPPSNLTQFFLLQPFPPCYLQYFIRFNSYVTFTHKFNMSDPHNTAAVYLYKRIVFLLYQFPNVFYFIFCAKQHPI